MSGWLVRASLSAPVGTSAMRADYRVAIPDETGAIAAVQAILGEDRRFKLKAVSQLSDGTLSALGIAAGEVRPIHGR